MAVRVTVRVKPRSRPGIAASGGVVHVSVAAPPVGGRATEEAARALAEVLGVARSRVRLVQGMRSRTKVFEVDGLTAEEAATRLGQVAQDSSL